MQYRRKHTSLLGLAAFTALGLIATRPAGAQTTMYTSQAGYTAASFPIATIAFDGLIANQNGPNY